MLKIILTFRLWDFTTSLLAFKKLCFKPHQINYILKDAMDVLSLDLSSNSGEIIGHSFKIYYVCKC